MAKELHTVWSDTNAGPGGLLGALALDYLSQSGESVANVRWALRHDCECAIGRDHTESGVAYGE